MATVAEVMNRDVLAVDPTASIGEAAEKMVEAGVGVIATVTGIATATRVGAMTAVPSCGV